MHGTLCDLGFYATIHCWTESQTVLYIYIYIYIYIYERIKFIHELEHQMPLIDIPKRPIWRGGLTSQQGTHSVYSKSHLESRQLFRGCGKLMAIYKVQSLVTTAESLRLFLFSVDFIEGLLFLMSSALTDSFRFPLSWLLIWFTSQDYILTLTARLKFLAI